MQININHNNFELTDAINAYAQEKLGSIAKNIEKSEEATLSIDLGKISPHHKHGNHYEVKCNLKYGTRSIHISSIKEDLYFAIDEAKDKLLDELAHKGDRERSMMKRFARSFKNIIKLGN
jgi:ribosomal subunit interface protein